MYHKYFNINTLSQKTSQFCLIYWEEAGATWLIQNKHLMWFSKQNLEKCSYTWRILLKSKGVYEGNDLMPYFAAPYNKASLCIKISLPPSTIPPTFLCSLCLKCVLRMWHSMRFTCRSTLLSQSFVRMVIKITHQDETHNYDGVPGWPFIFRWVKCKSFAKKLHVYCYNSGNPLCCNPLQYLFLSLISGYFIKLWKILPR